MTLYSLIIFTCIIYTYRVVVCELNYKVTTLDAEHFRLCCLNFKISVEDIIVIETYRLSAVWCIFEKLIDEKDITSGKIQDQSMLKIHFCINIRS